MVPLAFGGHRLLQGVAGLRHNHITLHGLALLVVVADDSKALGDLKSLLWMRSNIPNSKLAALMSVTLTFCGQLDCRKVDR